MTISTQCIEVLLPTKERPERRCRGRAWHGSLYCHHHGGNAPPAIKPDPPSSTNHPKHYNHGSIEAITVIEDWNLGFNLGNCVKYVARADHKGNAIEDLEKALWYLQRELARRKA